VNTGFQRTQRRARARFKRRLTAPQSTLHFMVSDGAISEKQAWQIYQDAFWDGLFDEIEQRHRRDAQASEHDAF
jgi:hypothetical protein